MANFEPTLPKCDQCGKYHPPLKDGQICPMSKQTDKEGNEIDVGDFLVRMKSILISNIQNKDIKDYEKFFSSLIVKLTKEIENYEEK